MVNFATAPLASLTDVTLANNVRLRYVRQGPSTGPAIIMLHGYTDSSFSFSRVMPLLPPELRVVAPDQRGHGDSDKPAAGYRIQDLADDVLHMMQALDIPSATIVGHSMGSFVAQAVAERAPERVTGLILLGSAAAATNDAIRGLRFMIEWLSDPVDSAFVRDFQYSTIARPVPDAFMEAAIANSLRMPAAIWKELLTGLMGFEPVLPRPKVRVLVLGGNRDAVFSPAEQIALAQQYPFSKLHLVDGVGHSLQWEQPETFVKALMDFLR